MMGEKKLKRKVTESRGQFKITLPRHLCLAKKIKAGDYLEFLEDRGDIVIRKIED